MLDPCLDKTILLMFFLEYNKILFRTHVNFKFRAPCCSIRSCFLQLFSYIVLQVVLWFLSGYHQAKVTRILPSPNQSVTNVKSRIKQNGEEDEKYRASSLKVVQPTLLLVSLRPVESLLQWKMASFTMWIKYGRLNIPSGVRIQCTASHLLVFMLQITVSAGSGRAI